MKRKKRRKKRSDMHSLMSVGFLVHLFMNDFLSGSLIFAVVM